MGYIVLIEHSRHNFFYLNRTDNQFVRILSENFHSHWDDIYGSISIWIKRKKYLCAPYLLCLPSIKVEIYCFTFHHSFVRPICCFVSVRSLRLSCRLSNTRRWPNVGLLLAHRLLRWANISSVLGYRVVFDATLNVGQRNRRRDNINPALVQIIVSVPLMCRYLLYVCGLWSSRQARSVRPGLVQCWPTVCAVGLAL